jgi:hypothetical protein
MCHQGKQDCSKVVPDQNGCGCSERRVPRQLQPFILLIMKGKDSYGYELIEKISEFRFHNSPPDVGAIYRNLRSMEKEVERIGLIQAALLGSAAGLVLGALILLLIGLARPGQRLPLFASLALMFVLVLLGGALSLILFWGP